MGISLLPQKLMVHLPLLFLDLPTTIKELSWVAWLSFMLDLIFGVECKCNYLINSLWTLATYNATQLYFVISMIKPSLWLMLWFLCVTAASFMWMTSQCTKIVLKWHIGIIVCFIKEGVQFCSTRSNYPSYFCLTTERKRAKFEL